MIRNALTGEPKAEPKSLVQQNSDFTAEGAPPPGTPPPGTPPPGTPPAAETPPAGSAAPTTPAPSPAR
jgi:hypothetical protein